MKEIIKNVRSKFAIIFELFGFLWSHKLWWLIPLILILLGFIIFFTFVQSTAIGPLIYPLF